MLRKNFFFYLLSFLEGASVMGAELLGAKMLAPYFGSSLYVWSAVLAVTLGGLAMGYFAGGIVSQKKNTERNLYFILLASAVFLVCMPMMAKEVMIHTAGFSLLVSIAVSCLIFLFPPVFLMGMVSPMIVGQISNLSYAGKSTGTVYAISTLGGILSTFLLGFYLIPNFGLTEPAIVIGIILGIIPFVKLITLKKFFSLVFPIAAFFSFNGSKPSLENSDVKILYSGEGLLGQIIVADYPIYEDEKKIDGFQRILFVNRSTQTIVTYKNGEKTFFKYVNLILEKTVPYPLLSSSRIEGAEERKRALVLGLGGGSVANQLIKNEFAVDAVELDKRMADAAKQYFDLDEKVNVYIDDARHYVKSQISPFGYTQGDRLFERSRELESQYSVIVLDAFIGETNPHHLFTTEFFSEIKSILSDNGIFFINGNGFWNGKAGKGMRSVCKTLINSGFDVEILPTSEEEDYRNLLFIAKPIKENTGQVTWDKSHPESFIGFHLPSPISDAVIFTDEKPQLEILNAEANKRWREACMKYFLSGYYSKRDVLLFK